MGASDLARRDFLKRSLVAGTGAVLASNWLTATAPFAEARRRHNHDARAQRTTQWSNTSAGCLIGGHALPRAGESTQRASTLSLEGELGWTLGVFRRYSYWDGPPPDRTHQWAADGGRIPYISWHAYTRNHTPTRWADIAAGQQDAYIYEVGQRLATFGHPIYFSFHHEPENDPTNGSPAEFAAAFERVRSVMDAAGATNLTWVCTLMGTTYRGTHGGADAWLPAPNSYHLVGSDGYNRWPIISKPAWRSFAELFTAAHQKSVELNKGLFVGEFGCVEQTEGYSAGDPMAKADWFQGAADTVRAWGNVEAMCYSHAEATFQGHVMPYWIDSSASSLASFSDVGRSNDFLTAL